MVENHRTFVKPDADELAGNGQNRTQTGRGANLVKKLTHGPELIDILKGVSLIQNKGRIFYLAGSLPDVFHQNINCIVVRRTGRLQVFLIGGKAGGQVEGEIVEDIAVDNTRPPHPQKEILDGNPHGLKHFPQRFIPAQRSHVMHSHRAVKPVAHIGTHQAAGDAVFLDNGHTIPQKREENARG